MSSNTIEKGSELVSKLGRTFGSSFQITVKLALSGIVVLLLLIPSSMIVSLIKEREERKDEVIKEISGKWGGSQTLAGPFISIPSKKKDESGAVTYFHFLPESLSVSGNLNPETRSRGIFDSVVYSSALKLNANFANFSDHVKENDLDISKALICIGLSDLKGIASPVSAIVNGKRVEFDAGIPSCDVVPSGISAKIPCEFLKRISEGENMPPASAIEIAMDCMKKTSGEGNIIVELSLDLNGSRELSFLPLGKTTAVKIDSAWSSPSFSGAYLPGKRDMRDNGFSAEWRIFEMNRAYPQQWLGKAFNVGDSSFGGRFLVPVNIYQQSSRTAKYAILFIIFTFSSLFFTEFFTKMRIHIVQYLMTGLGVVMFYSILLAVSEHVSFGWAYFLSAAAVIIMIGLYSRGILRNIRFSLALSAVITILYTYFYIILQMEDYALLTGNIGLFTVLGLFMFVTRNINRTESEEEKKAGNKGDVSE